jgi:multidrug efflux pump
MLVGLTSVFRANVPSLFADVNRTEADDQEGLAPRPVRHDADLPRSLYVNDFNKFGRTWQVVVQAEPRFRNQMEDVRRLKVRNASGRWSRSARSRTSRRSTGR